MRVIPRRAGARTRAVRALETPFGKIYGTNITPDPYTGIGNWSEQAFVRAMREGVDREGRHLYPAFPYDHFTRLTDDDLKALYAYTMTRDPVRAETPGTSSHSLSTSGPSSRDGSCCSSTAAYSSLIRSRAPRGIGVLTWPRVSGIAAHAIRRVTRWVPRRGTRRTDGGEIEGWHAPAINDSSPAPVPWTPESL